jgi:hypothetical protein
MYFHLTSKSAMGQKSRVCGVWVKKKFDFTILDTSAIM